MLIPRFAVWMFPVCMMILSASMASGQDYPNKPIRIVTSEPGSGNDIVARVIAPAITRSLGQPVIVDNRAPVIAIATVNKAAPDGYTLLSMGAPLWLAPLLQDNLPDPVKGFSTVTLATNSFNILVVHPSLPVKSVKELIALAIAKPGELNYASGSNGSTAHLAAELFNVMAGVKTVRIPYKGTGPAVMALVGGQVQLMFANMTSVAAHVKSGRLTGLAVTTAQPSALAPGLPTVAASGLPGYESVSPFGIFAPPGTPATVINRLNHEIVRHLNRADVKERFFNAGVEVVGSSPEELAATIKSEIVKWGKVIKDAGIKAD